MIIIGNTVTLAIDHYKISSNLESLLDKINYVFLSIFILEMLLKMIGLGFKNYFRDRYNDFDCIIVIYSIFEIIISMSDLSDTKGGKAL